ncbi:hypothetical protein WJX81_001219 [Elliptochloris bilobata]|uniref:Ferritin n=1 Tax=Elliptochloris bilobata TaxID=381761 RepID=A0AAW1RTL9_9CHLO
MLYASQPVTRPASKCAATKKSEELVVDFRPFEEVKPALATVEKAQPSDSFARVDYTPTLESAINEQINIEYNISYVYHALHSYFDRDNVALPNIAKYFNEQSLEERSHAQSLIRYQNKRGGRVKLHALVGTQSEFDHSEKGDALYAFELALSLEKLNFTKLWRLHDVAVQANDPEACNYIEDMLDEQAADVKTAAEYVSQLRRVDKGLGVYVFDKTFQEEDGVA